MEKYNGNPNVIIVDPEIHHVKITDDSHDFIVLGCDGIYDRMNTEQSCQDIWAAQLNLVNQQSTNNQTPKKGYKPKEFNEQQYHQCCGSGVDSLMVKAMKLQSLDNLSVVMIGLKGFYKAMEKAWEAKNSNHAIPIAPQQQNQNSRQERKSRDNSNVQSGGSN